MMAGGWARCSDNDAEAHADPHHRVHRGALGCPGWRRRAAEARAIIWFTLLPVAYYSLP